MSIKSIRQPFTANAVFTAHRPFQCNGIWYAAGEDFDGSEVKDERRLRKLYEARYLDIKTEKTTVTKEIDEEASRALSKKQERRLARKGK